MKLAFVMGKLRGGGAERVTASLINELSKDGHEIHLISFEINRDLDYPVSTDVIVHTREVRTNCRINAIFERISYFRRTIKKIKPACVICLDGPRIKVLLTIALLGVRCPLILAERNNPVSEPNERILRFLRTLCYTVCDGVVFQTEGARSFFSRRIRRKSMVIPNPISQQLLAPYNGIREKRIVNFCRLIPQKNLPLLFEAFSDIAEDFPEYILEIYGEGPLYDSLQNKIDGMKLEKRIFLRGFVNPVYPYIRNAALFVSSSNYEGISNSMLEAMAMGIPSICTDCPPGGASETILDGINGLLVPVCDRAAMGDAIRRVLSDRELSGRLSMESSCIRKRLDPKVISKQWLLFAEHTIQRSKKGAR